jgi:hypothetical protein
LKEVEQKYIEDVYDDDDRVLGVVTYGEQGSCSVEYVQDTT